MRTRFHKLYRCELDFLIENCNFTEDEKVLISMASQQKSDQEIASKLNISSSSVTKRKKKVNKKVLDFLEKGDYMTTVYVNGERVKKEELDKIEIHMENVKKILSEKLTKND